MYKATVVLQEAKGLVAPQVDRAKMERLVPKDVQVHRVIAAYSEFKETGVLLEAKVITERLAPKDVQAHKVIVVYSEFKALTAQ